MIRYHLAARILTVVGVVRTTRALAVAGCIAAVMSGAYMLGYLRPAQASIVPSQGSSTYLLFTYLVNGSGYDTTIAIANTSADPFGTPPQSGTCTLTWYGQRAPAPTTTPTIAAGTSYANQLSVLAPGFFGYMIAQCNFRYAHGTAFVGDVTFLKVVFPSPVNVIPLVPRPNNENLNN